MSAPSRCHDCHHKQGKRVSTKRKPACQCDCHQSKAYDPSRPVTIEEFRDVLYPKFHPGEIYDSEDLYMFYDSNHEEHGELDHASP